jgi:hypothetical protein
MKIFRTPEGEQFEVPDDATPEELSWLQKQGATPVEPVSKWKDGLKSLLSGTLEGAARAPYIAGDLGNLGIGLINKIRPGTIDPEYEKLTSDRVMEILREEKGIYEHLPETTVGKYANAGGLGIGGAAVFGGPKALVMPGKSATLPGLVSKGKDFLGRLLRTPGVVAPAAGMAAQGGMDLSDGNPAVAFATGAGSQLAMALAGRMLTPNHPAWIRHGTEGMSPDDWTRSKQNLSDLRQAGAQQHTLADAVPETARLRPMTADLSNTSGGQKLGELLSARNNPGTQHLTPGGQLQRFGAGDIPRLLDEASDAVGPPVNAGAVAHQMGQRGQSVVQGAKDARYGAYMPILEQAGQVPQQDIARILLAIRQQAGNPQNLGTVDQQALAKALETVRRTPLYPTPQAPVVNMPPGTSVMPPGGPPAGLPGPGAIPPQAPPQLGANLVALSKNVKDLKRGFPTSGDMSLNQAAGANAYRWADQGLKATSPDYARAMEVYRQTTENLVDPMKRGLPGQMAGLVDDPMRDGTLSNILRNAPQQEVQQSLPGLANTPALKRDLARVLADANKQPVSTAGPQQAMIDKARQTVTDLVDEPAKSAYVSKTRAADTLSRLTSEAGADATVRQNLGNSWVSKILAPIYEMRVRMNLRLSEKEARTLAELIGNPTDANMALLQKIAQERPDLQSALRQMGRISSVHTGTTGALIEE